MAHVATGIELSPTSMRLVSLKKGRKGPALVSMAKQHVPEGVITETGVEDTTRFKDIIGTFIERSGAGRANVCLSICSEHVDVRTLRLPRMPEKDLQQAIRWEIERLVRFDDDIFFDYEAMEDKDGHDDRNLLVVSAPRGLVYGYLLPFQSLGYFPEIIDVGGFSLPFACPTDGTVGHVILGSKFVHLLFFQNGVYKLSRLIPVHLQSMIEANQESDHTAQAASTSDHDSGVGPSHINGHSNGDPSPFNESGTYNNGDRVSFLDRLIRAEGEEGPVGRGVRELLRTIIQTLEGAHDLGDPDTLVVSGEGALINGMASLIEDETGIRTILSNPMIGPGDEGMLGDEAPAYAVAVGLALRGLDDL